MVQTASGTPQVGEQAPDFTLQDTEKKLVRLRDFRGRQVILAFFPAAFTGTCTAELCTFRDAMGRLNDANAQVLGISVDMPYSLREYRKSQGLEYPLLSDFDKEAVHAYGILDTNFGGFTSGVARRSVFVIDPEGAITWEWLAERPGNQPEYAEVLAQVGVQ